MSNVASEQNTAVPAEQPASNPLDVIKTKVAEVHLLSVEVERARQAVDAIESDMAKQQANSDELTLRAAEAERAARDAEYALGDAEVAERKAEREVQAAADLFAEIRAALDVKKRLLGEAQARTGALRSVATTKKVEAHLAQTGVSRIRLVAERDGARIRAAYALYQEKLFDARIGLEDSKASILRTGSVADPGQVRYLLEAGDNA